MSFGRRRFLQMSLMGTTISLSFFCLPLIFLQACKTEKTLGDTCLTLSAGLVNAPADDAGTVDYEKYAHLKTPPLAPRDALQKFELEPGFRIELVAHEPMVTDPVAMDIDADGRLWVVDMPSYMPVHDRSESETIPLQQVREARLVVLKDTNGDGMMDSFRVFADELIMPRAVKVLNDGVLVGEPPNVWFIQDTDGDGKGDSREAVYSSYGNPMVDNVQNMPNNFLWGLDNWIHSSHDNVDSIRRRNGQWQIRSFERLGQWGMSQDNWGRLYSANNTNPLQTHLVPYGYSDRHPNYEIKNGLNVNIARRSPMWPAHATGVNRGYRVGQVVREDGRLLTATATTGPVIYRGDQFGSAYRGNAFVPEPAGNLIKRYIPDTDPARIEANARFAYEGREFLTSTDERFRPVNMYNAPDGSLYVIDMYRGLFETALSLTDHLRKYSVENDLHKPVGEFGRIYRIVRDDREMNDKSPRFSELTPGEVAGYLRHDNGWLRDQAQQVLVQCSSEEVIPTLEELVTDKTAKAWTRLQALWTLEGYDRNVYSGEKLEKASLVALSDEHSRVRAAAIRILEPVIMRHPSNYLDLISNIIETEHSEFVNLQLLASLGESVDDSVLNLMARIIDRFSDNVYFREMLVTGVYQREAEMAEILRNSYGWSLEKEHHEKLLTILNKADNERPSPLPDHFTEAEQKLFMLGQSHFRSCRACHGSNGEGLAGTGSALAGSEWVQGDSDKLIRIVLHGFSGGAEERGEEISGMMPGHKYLSDEVTAGILTYIRQSWNNNSSPVEPEEVHQVRQATSERNTHWTPDELRAIMD